MSCSKPKNVHVCCVVLCRLNRFPHMDLRDLKEDFSFASPRGFETLFFRYQSSPSRLILHTPCFVPTRLFHASSIAHVSFLILGTWESAPHDRSFPFTRVSASQPLLSRAFPSATWTVSSSMARLTWRIMPSIQGERRALRSPRPSINFDRINLVGSDEGIRRGSRRWTRP